MKKLKLKLDGVGEALSKEQMKEISGGYGQMCCLAMFCNGGSYYYRLCDGDVNLADWINFWSSQGCAIIC